MNFQKRILAMLLSVVACVGSVSYAVFASQKMYQMIRRQFIKTLVNILIRMVSAPFAVRKIHIGLFQQTKTYCL